MTRVARPTTAKTVQALYTPLEKQLIAHTCPAAEMLYGGAAGGGKSAWTANDAAMHAYSTPGIRILILRRYTDDLQELIDYAQTIIPDEWGTYNQNKRRWVFNAKALNGKRSVIQFTHLEFDNDVYRHKSLQWDRIYFEEETTYTHFQRMYMRSRNRASVPNSPTAIRGTTNPGDIGHQDVKDYYVQPPDRNVELVAFYNFETHQWERFPDGRRGDPAPYLVWRPEQTPEFVEMNRQREAHGLDPIPRKSRCFIPATLYDNPYLAETDYQANLHALPPDERKALEEGDWDAFEGAFFKTFNMNTHVIHEFQIKPHWDKWRSFDWGYADAAACYWHTFDPENRQIITYREMYEVGLTDTQITDMIQAMTPAGEHINFTDADPSMWRADGRDDALSKAEIYSRNGVHLKKANNARVEGWSRMRDVLEINKETGKPGWVISSDCVNLIRELRGAIAKKKRPNDIAEGNDHALDSCRYGLLATPAFVGGHSAPVKAGVWR